jgi:hypothetical protein
MFGNVDASIIPMQEGNRLYVVYGGSRPAHLRIDQRNAYKFPIHLDQSSKIQEE